MGENPPDPTTLLSAQYQRDGGEGGRGRGEKVQPKITVEFAQSGDSSSFMRRMPLENASKLTAADPKPRTNCGNLTSPSIPRFPTYRTSKWLIPATPTYAKAFCCPTRHAGVTLPKITVAPWVDVGLSQNRKPKEWTPPPNPFKGSKMQRICTNLVECGWEQRRSFCHLLWPIHRPPRGEGFLCAGVGHFLTKGSKKIPLDGKPQISKPRIQTTNQRKT